MLWLVPSVLILVLVGLGPLGAMTGALDPGTGFGVFGAGVALAVLSAIALGGAAAFASSTGRAWRRRALLGALVPLLVTLAVVGPFLTGGGDHPIHDVTTDLEDGLAFPPDVAAGDPATQRELVLAQQRARYPDIAPLELAEDPDVAYERARDAARQMQGWSVVAEDPATRTIQAVAVSDIFRFRDDVIIRVSPMGGEPESSRVDVRSRSRIGQSDLGANAERIRSYLAGLRD